LNKELLRFATIVSHDLRRFDAEADEFFEFVTAGAKWMTRLISDLLEHSKAGAERTHLVPVDSRYFLILLYAISAYRSTRPEQSSRPALSPKCWRTINSPVFFKI
jgi:hypothetical protein